MKNRILVITIALLAALLATACTDGGEGGKGNGEDGEPEEFHLTLSPDNDIEFDAGGGSVTIGVDTNFELWTAKSDKDWCEVVEGDDSFTIKAEPNTTTTDMPAAAVTVTGGEGSDKITKTINVTQKGAVVVDDETEDLSADGTANCYIVGQGGDYSFDATVAGNGAAGIIDAVAFHTSDAVIAPVSAGLLWQDAYSDGEGFITSVELDAEGRVLFSTSDKFTAANAVIAVYDSAAAAGNILWSWHIWMPSGQVAEAEIETGYQIMNMNVGAYYDTKADPGSFGMLYQWGRKDPFPAADVLAGDTATKGRPIYDIEGNAVEIVNSSWTDTENNTLAYAIANPTVCLSNMAQAAESKDWLKAGTGIDALWGNPEGDEQDEENNYINKGTKSIYDPCPVGWRVPPADVFRRLTSSGGYAWANEDDTVPDFNVHDLDGDGVLSVDDYDHGWFFMLNDTDYSYFPAAARFDGSYAMLMGSMTGLWGSYWGNTPNDAGGFAVLSFQIKDMAGKKSITVSPSGSAARADAYSVRCIAE